MSENDPNNMRRQVLLAQIILGVGLIFIIIMVFFLTGCEQQPGTERIIKTKLQVVEHQLKTPITVFYFFSDEYYCIVDIKTYASYKEGHKFKGNWRQ